MMDKKELEKIARTKREKFANEIGLVVGSTNFNAIVDGPFLCTLNDLTTSVPWERMLTKAHDLDADNMRVLHAIERHLEIGFEEMHIIFYVVQNLEYDEDTEDEEYGEITYGEMSPGEFRVEGYGENLTADFCSEYGTAGIKCVSGTIVQTM